MPQVIVNTDELRDGSATINSASQSLANLAARLSHIPGSVIETGFEGQFAPKVRAMTGEAQSTSSGLQKRLDDLSNELVYRADRMDEVTGASSQRMFNIGAFFADLWKKSPFMWLMGEISQLPKAALVSILILGLFNPGLAIASIAITPILKLIGQKMFWKGQVYKGNPNYKTLPEINITKRINFRDMPGMAGAVIVVLPVGTVVSIIGQETQKDGHTWVQVRSTDGKTGWIAKDVLIQPTSATGSQQKIAIQRSGFSKPVDDTYKPTITQKYSNDHQGVDIAAKAGTPIKSSYVGTVAFAKEVNAGQIKPYLDADKKIVNPDFSAALKDESKNYGYGNAMIVEYRLEDQPQLIQTDWKKAGIKDGQSVYATYAHLEGIDKMAGDSLNPGDTIARMGTDGRSTGVHLHLQVKIGDPGKITSSSSWSGNGWASVGSNHDPYELF